MHNSKVSILKVEIKWHLLNNLELNPIKPNSIISFENVSLSYGNRLILTI